MPGRGLRTRAWAEEVDEEEASSTIFDEATGQYRAGDSAWHEGIEVQRGMSKHRLDTRHGFYRSIVRNQQERDDYEQSWQDAYKEAGPFQQRWGVGVKVQQTGRTWSPAEESRSNRGFYDVASSAGDAGASADNDRIPESDEKIWWRRPVDVMQSDTVRVLQRTTSPGHGAPLRPITHEQLEATLYNTHLSASSQGVHTMDSLSYQYGAAVQEHQVQYSQPPQQPQPAQIRVPAVGYDGIALGVPVYMQQPPIAGPPVPQEPMAAARQQAPAAAPAGWAYDPAISGWGGRSLPTPQIAPSPQHNAQQEHLPSLESDAAKEKVRLGFQVYRPPPQLGQPSSLELELKKSGEPQLPQSGGEQPRALPVQASDNSVRASQHGGVSHRTKAEGGKRAQHSSAEASRETAATRQASKTPSKGPKLPERVPPKLSKRASDAHNASMEKRVEGASSRRSRPANPTDMHRSDRGTQYLSPSIGDKKLKPAQESGDRDARKEALDVSGGSGKGKGVVNRRAVVAQAISVAQQAAPPGFESGSLSREQEERRRPAIGLIRDLISPQAAAVSQPDKASAPKAAATREQTDAAPNSQAGKPSKRERKGRRAEPQNGVASSHSHPQAESASAASKRVGKQGTQHAAQAEAPVSERRKNASQKARESRSAGGAPRLPKETSAVELSDGPPGLGAAEAGSSVRPGRRRTGKDNGIHLGVSKTLSDALAPAYFERPPKLQQPQQQATGGSIGRKDQT